VEIESISKESVKTIIIDSCPSKGEAVVHTVLYQGIPKSTKMDIIIQKCTEMGINRIVPVVTSRTIVKLETEKDERKKVERWSKIAEEAAKQSRRGIIPYISMPMSLSEALKDARELEMAIMPYELEQSVNIKRTIKARKTKSIGIFIGPEGGFDASEVEEAINSGVIPVTLGNRILRTETAGVVALTCVMYEFGELGAE
jgi:16S rRNA (uracil1498-N3)-methyltransferase